MSSLVVLRQRVCAYTTTTDFKKKRKSEAQWRLTETKANTLTLKGFEANIKVKSPEIAEQVSE